jgi:hypothetical protein
MWFKNLTGFEEKNPQYVKDNLEIQGEYLLSKINNKKFCFGSLEIPTLKELRERIDLTKTKSGKISIKEVVANVQELHTDPKNENAVFQAASQFNLLEMVGPHVTPEQGIDRYQQDRTQGPACAIACGAGTIYRNYFVEVNKQIGQTSTNQIDCLELIGKELDNDTLQLWSMENGYALVNQKGLLTINKKLANLSNEEREELKGKLKIGIQWNTEVTISEEKHKVTQVYCSALPVAYSHIEAIYWGSFARLILEATYEATLYAGVLNKEKTGCGLVYLTLVGGGAFGNDEEWILDGLGMAVRKFWGCGLDVRVVSYGGSNLGLVGFIRWALIDSFIQLS